MFLTVAEDSNFKPKKIGWKAKGKAVTRNRSPRASMGKRVGGTPAAEGDVIQVPSALSPQEPGQEIGEVRWHQGVVSAGSLSSYGISGRHWTPQSPLSPPRMRRRVPAMQNLEGNQTKRRYGQVQWRRQAPELIPALQGSPVDSFWAHLLSRGLRDSNKSLPGQQMGSRKLLR